jgi:hypothetical protein
MVVREQSSRQNSSAEPDRCGRRSAAAVVVFIIVDNDDIRAVGRNIHDLRVGRRDRDCILLDGDLLLVVRLQRPVRHRRRPRLLDCLHHVGLLREDGLAELVGPLQVLIHAVQHVWKLEQHEYARVPLRIRLRLGLAVVLAQEPGRLHNVRPRSGGRQNVSDQRIRIQRDRRHELLQFCRAELDRRRRVPRRRGLGRRPRHHTNHDTHECSHDGRRSSSHDLLS